MDTMDKKIQRWELGVLELFDSNDPLANFQQYGVEIEYTTKDNKKDVENEEHWRLSSSIVLNLQVMAFGPSALRDLAEHLDSEGKVELGFEGKTHKVSLEFLHSMFASNVQSGDVDFDDQASLRSETPEVAQLFLSSHSLRLIVEKIICTGGSLRIFDDRVEVAMLSKSGQTASLSDEDKGLLLSHILSVQ
jgi:hypothetical protein